MSSKTSSSVALKIENDVSLHASAANGTVLTAASNGKAAAGGREFQVQARDQFEARMGSMRDLLGVKGLGTKGERDHKKMKSLRTKLSRDRAGQKIQGRRELKARSAPYRARLGVAGETGAELQDSKKALPRDVCRRQAASPPRPTPRSRAKAKATSLMTSRRSQASVRTC